MNPFCLQMLLGTCAISQEKMAVTIRQGVFQNLGFQNVFLFWNMKRKAFQALASKKSFLLA
jgi:hypothetical protein